MGGITNTNLKYASFVNGTPSLDKFDGVSYTPSVNNDVQTTTNSNTSTTSTVTNPSTTTVSTPSTTTSNDYSKYSSFKEAFNAAKAAGLKEFTWAHANNHTGNTRFAVLDAPVRKVARRTQGHTYYGPLLKSELEIQRRMDLERFSRSIRPSLNPTGLYLRVPSTTRQSNATTRQTNTTTPRYSQAPTVSREAKVRMVRLQAANGPGDNFIVNWFKGLWNKYQENLQRKEVMLNESKRKYQQLLRNGK